MKQKGLLQFIVDHSFGYVQNTGQAAVLLLVISVILIVLSFMGDGGTTIENVNPHPVDAR